MIPNRCDDKSRFFKEISFFIITNPLSVHNTQISNEKNTARSFQVYIRYGFYFE